MAQAAKRTADDEKLRHHRSQVERDQAQALQRILRANPRDYRTILNLHQRGAGGVLTISEVTKAFRQVSLLVHPDKNSSSTASDGFQRLQAAYSALKEEITAQGATRNFSHPSRGAGAAGSSDYYRGAYDRTYTSGYSYNRQYAGDGR